MRLRPPLVLAGRDAHQPGQLGLAGAREPLLQLPHHGRDVLLASSDVSVERVAQEMAHRLDVEQQLVECVQRLRLLHRPQAVEQQAAELGHPLRVEVGLVQLPVDLHEPRDRVLRALARRLVGKPPGHISERLHQRLVPFLQLVGQIVDRRQPIVFRERGSGQGHLRVVG